MTEKSKPPLNFEKLSTEPKEKQSDRPRKDPDRFTWNDLGEIASDVGKVIVDVLIYIVG